MQVRIAWKSLITGFEGHGEWFDENHRETFQSTIARLNKEYKDQINHWLEEK